MHPPGLLALYNGNCAFVAVCEDMSSQAVKPSLPLFQFKDVVGKGQSEKPEALDSELRSQGHNFLNQGVSSSLKCHGSARGFRTGPNSWKTACRIGPNRSFWALLMMTQPRPFETPAPKRAK